jgi:hypothetical protein
MAITAGTVTAHVKLLAQVGDSAPVEIGTIDLDLPVEMEAHSVATTIAGAIRNDLKMT